MFFTTGCRSWWGEPVHVESRPWPLKNHTGTILETTHYRIYTTVKDPVFHSAAAGLAEGQYQRFHQVLGREPKSKMTVYIFSEVRQWMAFTQARFGDRAEDYLRIRNGGYTSGDLAAFYMMNRYATLTVMAHELFHLYLNHIATDPVPAWVNEGMSCYFEAHEWNVDTPVFTPNKNLFRRDNLREAMGRKTLFPIRQLLGTHPGEVTKQSQQKVLTYYAQVWALSQFLQDPYSGVYHARFKTLLSELGTPAMRLKSKGFLTTVSVKEDVTFGESVFREYIVDDLEQFEKDFNAYLPTLAGLEEGK